MFLSTVLAQCHLICCTCNTHNYYAMCTDRQQLLLMHVGVGVTCVQHAHAAGNMCLPCTCVAYNMHHMQRVHARTCMICIIVTSTCYTLTWSSQHSSSYSSCTRNGPSHRATDDCPSSTNASSTSTLTRCKGTPSYHRAYGRLGSSCN